MKIINETEFNELMKENKVVVADFFATWCGPCKMLAPILEQVQTSLKGNFEIVKIDVDESYDLAKKFGIMSVPTIVVLKNGEEKEKMVGLRQKIQIEDSIKKYL